jgi:hypothetical protein
MIESAYQYIIRKNGANYEAFNTSRDTVDSTSATNASVVLNYAINQINSDYGINQIAGVNQGGTIFIKPGTYTCLTTVNFQAVGGGNATQGIGIYGAGKATNLKFTPASTLTNAMLLHHTGARLYDVKITGNTNVTNLVRLTGTGGTGEKGVIQHCFIYGTNAETTNLPVTGQVGIFHDGAICCPYWWNFIGVHLRALDTGAKLSGTDATSTNWSGCTFQNCNLGMDIYRWQNNGVNLFFQGTPAVGDTGIRLRSGAYSNMFTNILGEQSISPSQTVLIDSGATHNSAQNVVNSQADGITRFGVVNNGGATNKVLDVS